MKFPPNTVQSRFESPLGRITLAATDDALVGVFFDQQAHMPEVNHWPVADEHPILLQAQAELTEYFAGQRRTFEVPLDLSSGTPFQQAVWQALLAIPCAATTSYGAISAKIGKPAAVRAVGGAVGRNPVSIIVPCHRLVGANGSLTGYAGGLPRKTALLQLEGAAPSLFSESVSTPSLF
ncbi:methylated-DNA--[protein]-cysteine S-methyltransferase [Rhodoferax sp. PAMC 29310]|uniref:methylated-DNA--[protein]-cysteine S-methyltransferase n=1 Tax=Rhodoferax sp. PAMC 29310 TaxID=2822760 RepID=UPI001B32C4BB|nr:methylated-DNA--[protein]-cysteine S-methyltransferase [Rhodoferax sp. PAMC 29310]